VKRADAICSAYRGSTQRLAHPRSYAEVLAYVKKTLPVYQAALQKLEQLKPPKQDEAAVRAWLAADRRIVKAEQKLADAALRRDFPDVVAASDDVQQTGVDARDAAAELGLKVCAQA
jgi:beta-phosphoglucomutase-like phosphatase (HAD superfamily)